MNLMDGHQEPLTSMALKSESKAKFCWQPFNKIPCVIGLPSIKHGGPIENLIGGFRWENHQIKCMTAQQTMFDYRRVYA